MPSARVAWFLAVATGLGLALAFPYPDFYALAWVALVPVIVASVGAGSWRRWWTGFLAGFVWRVGSLYWIAHVMINYGGMSTPVGMAVASLLAAWMALNTALILLLAPIAVRHGIVGAVVFASGWVSLEYLQAILPFGFPWSFLGYASGGSTVMMQASDLAGVWGLSFAAVFVNVVIAQRIILGRRALPSAVAAAVLVIGIAGYGVWRLSVAPLPGDVVGSVEHRVRVATVQGNVDQRRIWDPDERRSILANHVDMSLEAVARGADLVMWAESSVPVRGGLESDLSTRTMLAQFARQNETVLVVGSPHYENLPSGEWKATNSSFLVDTDGDWTMRYDKVHLVPWGEYVPASWLFRFVTPLVDAVGSFHRGSRDQALFGEPDGGIPPFAMAICYEVVFPDHMRRQVARGAKFLATITNDAWFGDTSAPYQHFSMARFRAVETRRYLVRAANTGISGFVDPWGRVLKSTGVNQSSLLLGEVWPSDETTLYVAIGDVLPQLCVVLTLVGVVFCRLRPPAPLHPTNERSDEDEREK
ncbi:MAG TPA: apolipoprotein N-acyltransferase [Acidobacteria bacterium]|nr:apolipoprotein N-acyltransferase [Acidobacteriota bacterium]